VGHQVIKQPDGRLAIFSDGVEDWIITDATQQEIEDYYADKAADRARESARETCEAVLAGNASNIYCQFTMTYEGAMRRSRIHAKGTES
jgi:hypothetical protein